MSTLKTDLYEICNEVTAEFPGWSFGSGQFKNKSLRHTDLVVYLGLGFKHDVTPMYPGIAINNKKSMKLFKSIIGYELSTSIVSLQTVSHMLEYTPEELRLGCRIVQGKNFSSIGQIAKSVQDRIVDIADVYQVLIATMKDGISFIENYYNLGGERDLLKSMPAKYTTRHINSPYDEMEKQKGVMMCIIHLLLGDFDFVEHYRSDDFKTIFPKRTVELDKIIAVLPELKRRYAETGEVI